MVVVFGGVGNLWGTLVGAFTLGIANKFLEPYAGAVLGQDRDPGADHPVHPEAPARPVRAQGPGGRSMRPFPLIRALDRGAVIFVVLLVAIAVIVPLLNLLVPASSPFHVSNYYVALFGKYLCYALLALSIDLIWGYCGILSLGHGAFFALGGYAMGMYLMRQIGGRGVYAHPILPDFMVFLNWTELPFYWYGFQSFPYAHADGAAGARRARLRLRLVRVPQPRHRRLSLDHHPGADLRVDARLLPQRFRLRRQQRPDRFQGHPRLQRPGAGHARGAVRDFHRRAVLGFLICRVIVTSKLGKVLIAIRDAETRTRFLGYRVESYKLFVFTLSACMAGVAGALYVPQVGIINPSEFSPANSIEAVIWVAVGGRGTLIGAVLGRGRRQLRQDLFHLRLPRALLAVPAGRPLRRGHAVPAARHRRHVPPPHGRAARATRASQRSRRTRCRADGGMPNRSRARGVGERDGTPRSPHRSSTSTASPSPSTASRR